MKPAKNTFQFTKIDENVIKEIVNVFVAAANPEQIILFGSFARGEAGKDSDLDFLVIEAEPFTGGRSRRKEMVRLRRAVPRKFLVPIDILVYSQDEVEVWRKSINHVVAQAFKEGKTVYERP